MITQVRLALMLAAIVLTTSPAAFGAESPVANSENTDAIEYAKTNGVTEEEAAQRLERQDEIGKLGAALEANEVGTFGGIYIEHEPRYRVVAQFTKGGPQTIAGYVDGSPLEPFVETEEVTYTWVQLLKDQEQLMFDLGNGPFDVDIDVITNRVVIDALSTTDIYTLAANEAIRTATLCDRKKCARASSACDEPLRRP